MQGSRDCEEVEGWGWGGRGWGMEGRGGGGEKEIGDWEISVTIQWEGGRNMG